jgi:hypothetical protein
LLDFASIQGLFRSRPEAEICAPATLRAIAAVGKNQKNAIAALQSRKVFAIGTLVRNEQPFPGSSVVEQPAVNRLVAGSNPARGAIHLAQVVDFQTQFDLYEAHSAFPFGF